jgi:hypothetical protein
MIKSFLLGIFAVVLLSSCDNDVDLIADYKDITFVYALLDQTQDTQWIRIQKAYLGEGNALLMAKQPDSLFYGQEQIDVFLRKLNSDGNVVDSTLLPKTLYGKSKDEGVFLTAPQYLYPFTGVLDQNLRYEILIRNKESLKEVKSVTRIARKPLITYPPNSNTILNWEFGSALPGANPSIDFMWLKSDNVVAYQFSLTFFYDEFPTSNPSQKTYKSFSTLSPVFNPFIDEPGANEIRYPITKRDFYNAVLANIPANPDFSRKFVSLSVTVHGATRDFYDYFEINRPSNSIVQKTTDFTNVQNGYGLFASRVKSTTTNLKLNQNTLDSLRNGQFTKELNFVN